MTMEASGGPASAPIALAGANGRTQQHRIERILTFSVARLIPSLPSSLTELKEAKSSVIGSNYEASSLPVRTSRNDCPGVGAEGRSMVTTRASAAGWAKFGASYELPVDPAGGADRSQSSR